MTKVTQTKHHPRLLRMTLVLLTVLLLTFSLTACVDEETKSRIRGNCETVLDGLLAGDTDAAYTVLTAAAPREEFDAFAAQIMPMLECVDSYELKQTGWHIHTENGVTETMLTYLMTCSDGSRYLVEVSETSDVAGLTGFFINLPESEDINDAPFALRIVFLVFSLIVFAFCIWMIVDCARRKVNQKALWILVILFGVTLIVRMLGDQMNFSFQLGLVVSTSSISLNTISRSCITTVTVPVGAVIYFCLRRRLTVPAVEPEPPAEEWTAEETQQTQTQENDPNE